MAEESAQELDLEIGGQKMRARGYRMLDLLWFLLAIGVAYCSFTLWQREAQAQTEKAAIAKALVDSNSSVATALKESNAAMVGAIKEANENTVKALNANTAEQKRSTKALREMACLIDPAMQRRNDARDFCKRLARDDG